MTKMIRMKPVRLITFCLLVLLLTIALSVGVAQPAHGAGEDVVQHVSIFPKGAAITNENIRELNEAYPYLVNGIPTNQIGLTFGQNGFTAWFDSGTGTLKLHGYDGGPIHLFRGKSPGSQFTNGFTPKELKIELHGTNTITSKLIDGSNKGGDIYGIYNGTDGDIVIKAGMLNAKLIIDLENKSNDVTGYGLNNTVKNSADNGIYIDASAIVEINAKKAAGTNGKATAIRTGQKGINIIGNAQLTIDHDGDGHCIFSPNGDFKIDTAGEVLINSFGSGSATAVYTSKIKLVMAKKFEIRWSGNRNFRGDDAFASTGSYAVNVNNTKKIANYRLGTPTIVKLAEGTGVINCSEAGVVGRTEGQFLQSDEIELVGRTDVSPYVFDKWEKVSGNQTGTVYSFVEGTTANHRTAKVKLGELSNDDLVFGGTYRTDLFTVQPTFEKNNTTITFSLSHNGNYGYIQAKDTQGKWYDNRSFGTANAGNYELVNALPSGMYRLRVAINSLPQTKTDYFRNHYSNEFEVDYTNPPLEGTITVSGNLRNGEMLTANANITSNNPTPTGKSYTWYRLDKNTHIMEVIGNSQTYTIGSVDLGHQIKVELKANNYSSYLESPLYYVEKEPYEGEPVSNEPRPEETLVETDTSLRFKGMLALEYNITDYGKENLRDEWERVEVYGEWIEFTDLLPGKPYTIWVRFPETDLHKPSDSDKHQHSTKYKVEIWSVNSDEPEVEYYDENTEVNIVAPPAPAGMEFDYWDTDDQISIESPSLSTTRFMMPDSSVVISAIYKNKPGVLVEGSIESYDSAGASVFIYDAALTDEEIRTDMKTGGPIHAKHHEAILGSPIKSGSKYTQAFSFGGVGDGNYKVAVYKPGKYVVKTKEIAVSGTDIDAGSLNLWLFGDVNGDGKVNVLDATQIIRYANHKTSIFSSGDEETKADRFLAADVRNDNVINVLDATQIIRYINFKTSLFDNMP